MCGATLPLGRVAMVDSFPVLALAHQFLVLFPAHPGEPGATYDAGWRPTAHSNGSKPPRPARHLTIRRPRRPSRPR